MLVFERDIYMNLLKNYINSQDPEKKPVTWTAEDKEFALKVMEQRKKKDD